MHSLQTLINNRQGKLATNLEVNELTAEELSDLVQSVLKNGAGSPVIPENQVKTN